MCGEGRGQQGWGGRRMTLQGKVARLSSLLELSSLVVSQLDLDSVLQTVVNTAREFSKAALSGLLVLSERPPEEYESFFVSGWATPPRHYPTGSGIFNLPLRTGHPLRVANAPDHPQSVGTPHGHPPIGPFLGVPLKAREHILGTLFVANLSGGTPFSIEDEELLVAFAAHAAVAIHNARLYRQAEELATLRERERLAMDLHDTVAQLFFTIGMEAEHLLAALPEGAPAGERLTYLRSLAAAGTSRVRGAIASLYDQGRVPGDANIYRLLATLVEEFKAQHRMQIGLMVTGPVSQVPDVVREVLVRAAREALTNVRKHAQTNLAVVSLVIDAGIVTLTVQDNGVGLPAGTLAAAPDLRHFGLVAIRRQAERLGGGFEINSLDEGGTFVRIWAPLTSPGAAEGSEANAVHPGRISR